MREIELLDIVIDKWKGTVQSGRYKSGCVLCDEYRENMPESEECINCPVCIETGDTFCYNTSFYATGNNKHIANNNMLSELYDVRRCTVVRLCSK